MKKLRQQLLLYVSLTRLDRPIGIYLVLWPTLWALWLAAEGAPSLKNLLIFIAGVVLMRSAGCVINDIADRKIDAHVQRTQARPLATGQISTIEALLVFGALCLLSFGLVLLTNTLTLLLSFGALALAACYPFMKRYTHLPQVFLGAAFACAVPMAFAAEAGTLSPSVGLVFTSVIIWTVAYDTYYAMVDRDDDVKIGVKSTAILFGEQDRFMIAVLQAMTIFTLMLVGKHYSLGWCYQLSIAVATGLFIYQFYLTRNGDKEACFKAFLHNNYVGMVIFVGITLDYAFVAKS